MVLESLCAALSPIKIYDTSAPALSAELRAYADEIERLYRTLDEMIPERFLLTATGEGLRVYEEMFGPERSALPAERRRELLKLRMDLGEGDFTPEGIRKALDSFDLEYVISEFPRYNKLNIIAQADYTPAEQAFIKREVEKILPTHLEAQLVFNTITWSGLDNRNRSFSQLDNDNLTWEQIDALV